MGVVLTIDDFGEGYSALNYLRRLPIHGLKLSQMFVEGVPGNPSDVAVCQAVAGIARSLGLGLVAEGVETEAQRQFLLRLGVPIGQGFLFAPGLKPDEFARRLEAGGCILRRQRLSPMAERIAPDRTSIDPPDRSPRRCRHRRDHPHGDAGIRRQRLRLRDQRPGSGLDDPRLRRTAIGVFRGRTQRCRRARIVEGGGGIAPLAGGDDDTCELRKMYFLPSARGLGAGAALMARCLDAARGFGFPQCYLETLTGMDAAMRLYERSGFRRIDARDGRDRPWRLQHVLSVDPVGAGIGEWGNRESGIGESGNRGNQGIRESGKG